jgi:hypothetical protein
MMPALPPKQTSMRSIRSPSGRAGSSSLCILVINSFGLFSVNVFYGVQTAKRKGQAVGETWPKETAFWFFGDAVS